MYFGPIVLAVTTLQCALWCGFTAYGLDRQVAVVGMFQVKEDANGKCDDSKTYVPSVMTIEAIKWTFRNLFESGDAPAIELIPYKTCGLSDQTTEHIINILADKDKQQNQQRHIAGIIGPEFSEEAKIVAEIITSLPVPKHIAQVSYSATAQLLGDKSKYPNFFRVIPNDEKQVETMVQMMLQLQWNRIALVHDDDLYGKEVARSLRTMATARGICIPTVQQIDSKGTNTDQYQRVLDEILINVNPSIKGLVFVGRQTVAHLFMKFMSKESDFTNTPALILSESVQLQRDAFSDTNGDIFATSKGSYVLSPDYTVVTEFTDYWGHLFSNQTQLMNEYTTNPWLLDVYEESFGCRPSGTSICPALSERQITNIFAEQPLYVRYGILAAYTISAAIRNTVSETCGNITVCQEFFDNTDSQDILRHMNGLDISIENDFIFKPETLSSVSIAFDASSGNSLGNDVYKVYNLRRNSTFDEQFNFIEVAVYNGSSIDVNTTKIVDYYYGPSGRIEAFPWPDVRKAQCPAGHLCSECIPSHATDDFVFIEGDFYIVALVPNRESDSEMGCGKLSENDLNDFGIVVAIQKAVGDFNKNNQFGQHRVGLVLFDSCSNPTMSDWRIKDTLKSRLTLNNGTTIFIADRILGVVASYFSSVSVAISQTLTLQKILHLAYGATSPELSKRTVYPYFMRVSTPDQQQAFVVIKVLKQMGVNYLQLIYSEDAYGEGFRDEFTIAAEIEGICVANKIGLSADSSSKINQVYNTLRNKPFAKLVVVVLSTFVNELLKTLTEFMDSGEFLFLGSETWGINMNTLRQENSRKLLGSITINLELPDSYGIVDTMKDIDTNLDDTNPWTENYLQSMMRCHYDRSFDKRFSTKCSQTFRQFWNTQHLQISSWGPFSYLAVQSLLNGTQRFFRDKCSNRNVICDAYKEDIAELIEQMKETSKMDILGTGKLSRVFDENGDGNVGYVIYNIQQNKENPSSLTYVEVGRYSTDGSFYLKEDMVVSISKEPFVSVCPNKKACDECLTVPAGPSPNTVSSSPPTAAIALGAMVGVLVVVLIVMSVAIYYLRRQIKKLLTGGDGYITPTHVRKQFDNTVYDVRDEDVRDRYM